jgi:hypothetical protein
MYTDNSGGKSNLTWDFATADSNPIAYPVSFPAALLPLTGVT